MTVTSYPGVYMEEIASGARPIEAAGSSTAAFFGVADRGPIGEVRKIFKFDEFVVLYGGFRSDHQFLAHGVYQFFNNGGKECYVGRVSNNYQTASITIFDRVTVDANKLPCLTISAKSPGVWGNSLAVHIQSESALPNVFNLKVYIDDGHNKVNSKELESYENLSMDPDSVNFVEAVINTTSSYISVNVADNKSNAVKGDSLSGLIDGTDKTDKLDGTAFITIEQNKFLLNINGDGWRTVDIATAMDKRSRNNLNDISDALSETINALLPLRSSTPYVAYAVTVGIVVPSTDNANRRSLRITSGLEGVNSRVEILPSEDLNKSLTGALSLGVRNGGIETYGYSPIRPMDNTPETASEDFYYFIGDDNPDSTRVYQVVSGNDGNTPQPPDYAEAFHWLDKIPDVSLIAVPGVGAFSLADSGMNYCRNRPLSDCFYIADMPCHCDTLDEAKSYRDDINTPNSYGAVYFPWLKIPDPTGKSPQPIVVPPSGFVAGMYAQIDARRGVWKAPAGLETALAGAVGLTAELTDQEHGNLNKEPKSVCVIRKFASSGLVIWGARTLSSDAEYKYIPVRRMAIMLRKSIFNGIQWAVFEGNDEQLWSSLRLNIGSFMNGLFRSGAFQGSKASDAYFVRCGLGDTMTQGDIDRGEVIVQIGFAPLKPAEFVIVRIQQKVGQ